MIFSTDLMKNPVGATLITCGQMDSWTDMMKVKGNCCD